MRLAVSVQNLRKDYVLSGETVHALRGVSFDVPEGDYISIMGPSGSGKSTLLNLLGCLDRPTSGRFMLSDVDVSRMSDDSLAEIRATRIGFIFQSYNLLPALTVLENIGVPLYYSHRINSATRKRCLELAEMVGLRERLQHRPTQLSGGQQQRVAIARSLVNDPEFILADEPRAVQQLDQAHRGDSGHRCPDDQYRRGQILGQEEADYDAEQDRVADRVAHHRRASQHQEHARQRAGDRDDRGDQLDLNLSFRHLGSIFIC